MSKVLLTNAQLRKTLASVRSLGKRGIDTIVVEETRFSPTAFSKYCKESLICPSPSKSPNEFHKRMIDVIHEHKPDVYFPMDEDTIALAVKYREELNKMCRLVLPPTESYNITSDKGLAYKHAMDVGVQCPKTVFPENSSNLQEVTKDLKYPLVIKPVKSNGGRGIKIIKNSDELEATYLEVHKDYPFPVIQEHIGEGTVYDVVLLYNSENELRASFIQKQVRKYPFETGPSSVQESVFHPEMLNMAIEYMKKLPWYGIADIEFMVQKDTGKIFFIELNAKLWNSLQMAIYAGVDFPWLMYKLAVEGDIEPVHTYKSNIFCRNLLPSDILHFVFNKDRKSMYPPFLGGKKHNVYDDIICKDDPLAVLGFTLACFRYILDIKMWKFLLRF